MWLVEGWPTSVQAWWNFCSSARSSIRLASDKPRCSTIKVLIFVKFDCTQYGIGGFLSNIFYFIYINGFLSQAMKMVHGGSI